MRPIVTLTFLLLCGLLVTWVTVWLYRRPTIRRNQVKAAKAQAADYKSLAHEYEDVLRRIRTHVNEVGEFDSPLAMKILLEIEDHQERLDTPYLPLTERKTK